MPSCNYCKTEYEEEQEAWECHANHYREEDGEAGEAIEKPKRKRFSKDNIVRDMKRRTEGKVVRNG